MSNHRAQHRRRRWRPLTPEDKAMVTALATLLAVILRGVHGG